MSAESDRDLTLGFDTATDLTTAAVTNSAGETVAESKRAPAGDERPAHASDLLPAVEECVEIAGGWQRIARIGIGVGPGSYTGLRVGVATGRALGQATGIELVPVSTLAALAAGVDGLPDAEGRPRLAVLDARRKEAFVTLLDAAGSVLVSDSCVAPSALGKIVARAGASPLAVGDGSLRFCKELEDAGAEVAGADSPAHSVSARYVCHLASKSGGRPIGEIEPIYLREPDAKRWLERDAEKSD